MTTVTTDNGKVRPSVIPSGHVGITYKVHLDYDYSAQALATGNDIFFAGIRRQTAYKAAKKLSKMVGQNVVAFPATNDGQKGYAIILASKVE